MIENDRDRGETDKSGEERESETEIERLFNAPSLFCPLYNMIPTTGSGSFFAKDLNLLLTKLPHLINLKMWSMCAVVIATVSRKHTQ